MDREQLIYPLARLLANPRIFHAISEYLDGPDADTLKDALYDLLEYDFNSHSEPDDCTFEAEEVCFKVHNNGEICEIILDTGIASRLEAIEGEIRAQITSEEEMATTSAIYQRIVTAIEESHPELAGNIALCSPPTPGNHYLRSDDRNRFEGSFHLLTDPETMYAFNIDIIDVSGDELKATIKPI
jgi:hypothetical protein